MKIKGIVEKGKREASILGFPTLNISLDISLAKSMPRGIFGGIFAGRVGLGKKEYFAAIFIPEDGRKLEAHLLDWAGEALGEEIEVTIGKKIRDAVPYESDRQMKALIKSDVEAVRRSVDENG